MWTKARQEDLTFPDVTAPCNWDIRNFSTLTSVSWTGLKNWQRPCKTKKCDVSYLPGFPGGLVVKNPPVMLESQETQIQSCRKTPCRRAQQPIPVFLPGESHGEKSLVHYSPWVAKNLTLLKRLSMHAYILSSRAEEQLWSHCCCWVRYSQITPSWVVGWSGIRGSSFSLTCRFQLGVKGTSQACMDGAIRAQITTLAPSVD